MIVETASSHNEIRSYWERKINPAGGKLIIQILKKDPEEATILSDVFDFECRRKLIHRARAAQTSLWRV